MEDFDCCEVRLCNNRWYERYGKDGRDGLCGFDFEDYFWDIELLDGEIIFIMSEYFFEWFMVNFNDNGRVLGIDELCLVCLERFDNELFFLIEE